MTFEAFNGWLAAMGISGTEAGRRLGFHANTITKFKRRGAPAHVALACAALYHRLEPWK